MVLCFMINFFIKTIDYLKEACSLPTFLKEKKTLVSVQVQKDFTRIRVLNLLFFQRADSKIHNFIGVLQSLLITVYLNGRSKEKEKQFSKTAVFWKLVFSNSSFL